MPEGMHFHYLLWEDWRNGLYGHTFRESVVSDSAGLLGNPEAFAAVLNEVGQDWPIAVAQNLSDVYRNHQPWCGRAASCYEFGATIEEVNAAWSQLSYQQRVEANRVADAFTYSWRAVNMLGQMQWPI